jgi:hypothetical protein
MLILPTEKNSKKLLFPKAKHYGEEFYSMVIFVQGDTHTPMLLTKEETQTLQETISKALQETISKART